MGCMHAYSDGVFFFFFSILLGFFSLFFFHGGREGDIGIGIGIVAEWSKSDVMRDVQG